MRPTWDEYFMAMAKLASTRSTCNSRPTGAIIVKDNQVIATGYNGAMAGAEHCLGKYHACIQGPFEDPVLYCARRSPGVPVEDRDARCMAVHAEANAVAQAACKGISIEGSTCYCTLGPCETCLKLMAAAGVKHILYEYGYRDISDMVKKAPISSYKTLKLSKSTIDLMQKALGPVTSKRRIK